MRAAARELAGVAECSSTLQHNSAAYCRAPAEPGEVAVAQQVGANVDAVPNRPSARVEVHDLDPARREWREQIAIDPGLHALAKRARAAADIKQRR